MIASAAATPSAELQSSVEDLLQVLQPETAKILRDIGERLRTGSLVGTVCEVEHGIGICTEELKDHGASIPEIVRDLGERNWLWTDVKKPSRRVHQIDLPGDRKARMLVLRKDIGTAIGLGAAKVSEMPDAA